MIYIIITDFTDISVIFTVTHVISGHLMQNILLRLSIMTLRK